MNGGRLVATGDVTLGSETGGGNDFGYYAQPNVGIVEANGVYKSAAGGAAIGCYLTNFVVGAGGFGMLYHDYNFNLIRDTTLTAKADESGAVSFRGFKGNYRLAWRDASGAERSADARVG